MDYSTIYFMFGAFLAIAGLFIDWYRGVTNKLKSIVTFIILFIFIWPIMLVVIFGDVKLKGRKKND